jgi:hypothetical protein
MTRERAEIRETSRISGRCAGVVLIRASFRPRSDALTALPSDFNAKAMMQES